MFIVIIYVLYYVAIVVYGRHTEEVKYGKIKSRNKILTNIIQNTNKLYNYYCMVMIRGVQSLYCYSNSYV